MKRSLSSRCEEKVIYAAMVAIQRNGGSMYYKDIIEVLKNNYSFSKWENSVVGKVGRTRWQTTLLFFVIHYCMAGFITKKRGIWSITPKGEDAIRNGSFWCYQQAETAFKKWKLDKKKRAKAMPSNEL